MKNERIRLFLSGVTIAVFAAMLAGCTASAGGRYYGKTVAPTENVLRYISGSEPESLDPAIPTGQPEARILIALYDGLVEYDPKSMQPIPSIARSWEISDDGTEYTFHLRDNAKFSNGTPITAKDFVYSFRRALSPELAARYASLGYYIENARAYNSGECFARKQDGSFLYRGKSIRDPSAVGIRLTVPCDEKSRNEPTASDPNVTSLITDAEFVPVKAEDIGVEAIDEYTLKVKLYQPAPYFLGLLAHQFFRAVDQKTIEKYGADWTKPENIVTSGAFKLEKYRPFEVLSVVKNPYFWDADSVRLDRIEFYPMEEQTTMMNLYKAGDVDALYNHTVPAAWNSYIRQFKDEYLLHPEVATEFYIFNTTKPPFNNEKLRKAFSLAIDRNALAKYRKTVQPLVDLTPVNIFPKYEQARAKVFKEELDAKHISAEDWNDRTFDPEKARRYLVELGYNVKPSGNGFVCDNFPVDTISVSYNTAESNKAVAEFIQSQWKQNLGITVPLENMEMQTFLPMRKKLEYSGIARGGWAGDYMDPFTFLGLFYSDQDQSNTGWHDEHFDEMLDQANKTIDEEKRLEILARAEFYLMDQQPILPLSTSGTSWMKKPYVKGMYPNPGTLHAWKYVYIERDPSKWDRDVENIMNN